MKRKIWTLLGIGIIVLISTSLVSCKAKDISLENRDHILEYKDIKDYIVFIEGVKGEENRIKLYNKTKKTEEFIEDLTGNFFNLQIAANEEFFIVDEGDGLVKTTYIIPLKDVEKSKAIKTIGNVLISPDSNKLLIGVDNLKARELEGEFKEELRGTVDLVVYYIDTGNIRTFLEADEDHDYQAVSWDKEENIKYKKISKDKVEELNIKYRAPAEELLMEAIYSVDHMDISQVMEHMGNVDFNELETIYGENSTMEFLQWLKGQEVTRKKDIVILINSLENFYGKEYFLYIENLAQVYIEAKLEFIKALAQVPDKLEDIAYALNYMRVYDMEGQDMWRDLNIIANSQELNEKEREVGIGLIHFYSQCST